MKIGTVTYHRANNYGAVLQAYALCRYLQQLGYDAEIIDYWPKHHALVYNIWSWDGCYFQRLNIKEKLWYLFFSLMRYFKKWRRNRRFNSFRGHEMRISKCDNEEYDAVFYGSDTIWNQWNLNKLYSGFDPVYWGNDKIKSFHKFSYAPSMGNVIDNEGTKLHCEEYLKNFDLISVREEQLQQKIEEWGWDNVIKTIDPTMLLTAQEWESIIKRRIIKENYILCYNLECSEIIKEMACALGEKKAMKVIYLTADTVDGIDRDTLDTAGPYEFLSLVQYASYVMTSSFHGVVFSLIFHKQFCYGSSVETERVASLLNTCDLSERFVEKSNIEIFDKYIDYKLVNEKLETSINVSKKFISDCLKCLD